jgi:hypothetical protein
MIGASARVVRARDSRLPIAAAFVAAFAGSPALADDLLEKPTAIEVDRHAPGASSSWLGLDDATVIGLGHWAGRAGFSLASRPITLGPGRAPVEYRGTLSAAIAWGATETIEIGAMFPLVLQSGERLAALGDPAALQTVAAGDVRVGGKAQLVRGRRVDVAIGFAIGLPSGADDHFAGDASWTADWRGLVGARLGWLELAAGAGVRLRGREVALDPMQAIGNELHAALAASMSISRLTCGYDQVRLIAEIDGVVGDNVGGERGPSPFEARVGARVRLWRGWTIALAGGRGIVDEVGAPAWRALVDVAWTDAPRGDWDGDRIRDRDDPCPLGDC